MGVSITGPCPNLLTSQGPPTADSLDWIQGKVLRRLDWGDGREKMGQIEREKGGTWGKAGEVDPRGPSAGREGPLPHHWPLHSQEIGGDTDPICWPDAC